MAQLNSGKNIKRSAVKQIFATMDYGDGEDNLSSAEAWLRNVKIIAIYKDGVISSGKSFNIKDFNGETLLDVVTPLLEDADEIIAANISNWENKKKAVLLYKLSNELEKHSSLICQLEILVRGILGKYAKMSVLLLIDYLRFYASQSAATNLESVTGVSLSIIGDDISLSEFGFILGSALAKGCDVVLQTTPRISIIAMLIKQLAEEIGFPKNAIRVLPGSVDLTKLCKHKNISMVSTFGNLHEDMFKDVRCLGRVPLISVSSSRGPMIVFNNADLDSATNAVVDAAWGYSTVLPWSLNTVMVQEDVYHVFVAKLKSYLSKIRVGKPDDKQADVSDGDLSEYLNVQKVIKEAKLLRLEVIQNSSRTVIIGGDILRNLGLETVPVVSIVAFRNTTEAVSLANSNKSHMGISIWTENIGLANEVSRRLQFTNIWINSFGKFSVFHPVCSYDSSGFGYSLHIKGALEFNDYKYSIDQAINEIDKTGNLHSYNIDGIFGQLVGKNILSAVTTAKKGYETWRKKGLYERFKMLVKLSFEIESSKDLISKKTGVPCRILDYWIDETYKAFAQYANVAEVECNDFADIKTFRDPVGVIVIDESLSMCSSFICIIGSLLLGNSVILLNYDRSLTNFYVEICRLLTLVKFTAGVVNVILNCEDDAFENLLSFEDLNTFIYFERCPKMQKIRDHKRMCDGSTLSFLLSYVTKIKTVWSNVEHSIM